jgi:hypothetical protein
MEAGETCRQRSLSYLRSLLLQGPSMLPRVHPALDLFIRHACCRLRQSRARFLKLARSSWSKHFLARKKLRQKYSGCCRRLCRCVTALLTRC